MTVTDLPSFVVEVFSRVVAMEKATVTNAHAASYASFSASGGDLYWTNRLGSIPAPVGRGTDELEYSIPIIMRLHSGYITQGFPGALEDELQQKHAPTVMQYFQARRDLIYQAGQARINFMSGEAEIECTSGLSIFEEEDGAKKMLGIEFRLTVKAQIQVKRTI